MGTETTNNSINKERMIIICIVKSELENKIHEIKSLKMLKEETENAIKALELEVITFLQETEECKTTDKNGKEVLQYIGSDYKATYSEQTRETLDKEEVKKILSTEEYEKVRKESHFNVLRIK